MEYTPGRQTLSQPEAIFTVDAEHNHGHGVVLPAAVWSAGGLWMASSTGFDASRSAETDACDGCNNININIIKC